MFLLSWLFSFISALFGGTAATPQAGAPATHPAASARVAYPIAITGSSDPHAPLVIIDAGHGGHDPGALSFDNKHQEKNATLAIAQAVARQLGATGRFRVGLTRSEDIFLPLTRRSNIADYYHADLFVSIHADSAATPEARGASVFTLSDIASDATAARTALRENSILAGAGAQAIPQDDVQQIIDSLRHAQSVRASKEAARLIEREAHSLFTDAQRSRKSADFVVLRSNYTPSILIETGYISNTDDAALIFSHQGVEHIAGELSRSIAVYFARRHEAGD